MAEAKLPEQDKKKFELENYYRTNYDYNKLNALMHVCKSKNNKCFRYQMGMRQILNRFDKLRANIQAIFLRDYNNPDHADFRRISTVMIDLYRKMGLNFAFIQIFVGLDADKNILPDSLDAFERKIKSKYMIHKKEDPYYAFVHVMSQTHVNIHLIKRSANGRFKVYIYEPHIIDYPYVMQFRELYNTMGYTIMPLPNNILKQVNLPICFMYVMHFFLRTILYPADITNYDELYDDNSIITFTRFILKLAHNYDLIGDKITYYLLTNNTDHIIRLIENDEFKTTELSLQHLHYISSTDMLDVLFSYGITFKNIAPSVNLIASYNIPNLEELDKKNKIILYALESMRKMNKLDQQLVVDLFKECKILEIRKYIIQLCNDYSVLPLMERYTPDQNMVEYLNEAIKCGNDINWIRTTLLTYPQIMDIYDNSGRTPLFVAVETNKIDIVQLLVDGNARGHADVNKMVHGQTPLFTAILMNNIDIVRLLVSRNADVNQIVLNQSPLEFALNSGCIECAVILLSRCPNFNDSIKEIIESKEILDNNMERILDAVIRYNCDMSFVGTIIDNYPNISKPIEIFGKFIKYKSNTAFIEFLLDAHPEIINLVDRYGNDAMSMITNTDMQALEVVGILNTVINNNNSVEFVSSVLNKYPRIVDERDSRGNTPLVQALLNNRIEIVELMLCECRRFDIKNNNDIDAISIIKQNSISDSDMIKILDKAIECGSDMLLIMAILNTYPQLVNRKNMNGKTPVDMALQYKRKEIMQELLKKEPVLVFKQRLQINQFLSEPHVKSTRFSKFN